MKPNVIIKKDDKKIKIYFTKEYIHSLYRLSTAPESTIVLSHEIYKDDWTKNQIMIAVNNTKGLGHGIETNFEIPIMISLLIYVYEEDNPKPKWESYNMGNFDRFQSVDSWVVQFDVFTSESKKWKKDMNWIKDNFNREIDILVE